MNDCAESFRVPLAIDGLKPVSTRATHPMNELDPLALPAAFGARTRLPGVARPGRDDAPTDQRDGASASMRAHRPN